MILKELSNHQSSLNIIETKKNDSEVIQTSLIKMNEKVEKESKEISEIVTVVDTKLRKDLIMEVETKVRHEFEQKFDEKVNTEDMTQIVKTETIVPAIIIFYLFKP